MEFSVMEMPQRRIKPREAARLMGIAPGTLGNWRREGFGPDCYSDGEGTGARYWYVLGEVLAWMEANPGKTVRQQANRIEAEYERQKTA